MRRRPLWAHPVLTGVGLAALLVLLALNVEAFYFGMDAPRLLASVVFADLVGILGGYVVSVFVLGTPGYAYIERTKLYLEVSDVTSGLVKAAVFGGIIAFVGCYQGFATSGGAEGVGQATTHSVVYSLLAILVARCCATTVESRSRTRPSQTNCSGAN